MIVTLEKFNTLTFSEKIEVINDLHNQTINSLKNIVEVSKSQPIEVKLMLSRLFGKVVKDSQEFEKAHLERKERIQRFL